MTMKRSRFSGGPHKEPRKEGVRRRATSLREPTRSPGRPQGCRDVTAPAQRPAVRRRIPPVWPAPGRQQTSRNKQTRRNTMAKKALITAAAGGIGAVIARRAKNEGYEVFISDIDRTGGERLAAEAGLTFIPCDLASEPEIVALIGQVGVVDLLGENGGLARPPGPGPPR